MRQGNYDVVVIGSGMGGMAAAALLSHRGYKTLVVESKGRLGGRFSTIEHEGFKVPTGAIVIHTEGWVIKLLKEVGVNVEWRMSPSVFYRIEGKDHELPHTHRLGMLLDMLDKIEIEKSKMAGRIAKEVASKMVLSGLRFATKNPEKYGYTTFRDWLLQYTDNPGAHEVFDQLCVSLLMAHSWELPADQFFLFMSKTGGMKEMYIAAKGNITVMEALASVVKVNGDVWVNCQAKQVLVSKGKATGVIVEKDGQSKEIPCQTVVSDIGPTATLEITGKAHFNDDYLKMMRMKLRPSPCVLILVASDKPLCLDGKPGILTILGARRIAGTVPISNICPELAPPGQHLLYMSAEPLSKLLPMDKEYEIQQCMLDLKEQFPDFEKHGRVLSIEPRNVDHEWPELRTWNGYGLPIETPIADLYNIGDGCIAQGLSGSSGAAETGFRAADAIRRRIKPG